VCVDLHVDHIHHHGTLRSPSASTNGIRQSVWMVLISAGWSPRWSPLPHPTRKGEEATFFARFYHRSSAGSVISCKKLYCIVEVWPALFVYLFVCFFVCLIVCVSNLHFFGGLISTNLPQKLCSFCTHPSCISIFDFKHFLKLGTTD
jgi:hypothetical protein